MPLKIVRNDITRMKVDAIVNTANPWPTYGPGTDTAVYQAAGIEKLLAERESIGLLSEGDAVITKGYDLDAPFIIHAVSPKYLDGKCGEEERLRSCYRKSLALALENQIKSIAFPLISSGEYGYPKDEALRVAMDELNHFLLKHDMLIYLVVFDADSVDLAGRIFPDLEEYISQYDVDLKLNAEYRQNKPVETQISLNEDEYAEMEALLATAGAQTFSDYLLTKIGEKGMKNTEVYQNCYVSKKLFSKIISDPSYHPGKITALCLAVGAKMNFPEAVQLLSLAGYTFSDHDKTDIIFSYFIRHYRFDIYEINNTLEMYGLPSLIKS